MMFLFLSILDVQDFEEQPAHGTHPFHIVPNSKSQNLVSFSYMPFSVTLLIMGSLDKLGGLLSSFFTYPCVLQYAYYFGGTFVLPHVAFL